MEKAPNLEMAAFAIKSRGSDDPKVTMRLAKRFWTLQCGAIKHLLFLDDGRDPLIVVEFHEPEDVPNPKIFKNYKVTSKPRKMRDWIRSGVERDPELFTTKRIFGPVFTDPIWIFFERELFLTPGQAVTKIDTKEPSWPQQKWQVVTTQER